MPAAVARAQASDANQASNRGRLHRVDEDSRGGRKQARSTEDLLRGRREGKIDSQKTSACLRGAATWWLVAIPIFFCENSGSLAILTAMRLASSRVSKSSAAVRWGAGQIGNRYPLGHRLGLASLMTGTLPPLPFQLPPLSSSRAKQPG
jgi:hypothetical protein